MTKDFGSGKRINVHDPNTGRALDNVLDVADELLGTTMHIVAPDIMNDRWLKYFLVPFQKKDLKDSDLMNNRKKAAYFMQEMILARRDPDNRDIKMASFYLERICYAYQLLKYDKWLEAQAISCEIDAEEGKELDKIHGIERK